MNFWAIFFPYFRIYLQLKSELTGKGVVWAAIFLKHDEKKLDAKTMRKILESSDKKKFMQKFSNEYYQDMFDEAVGT